MSLVAARKCERHPVREAVARCGACTGHFCRECVSEHAGRLLCAPCLAREAAAQVATGRARWRRWADLGLTAAAAVFLWVMFYAFGHVLKMIPPKVHEGTVWRTDPES